MKVTVTKYLNVRVGEPSVNAPCYQYLAPGSELEIDGKSYPGDSYKDNNIWYRDEANNYYWSGGVAKESSITEEGNFIERVPLLVDYNSLIQLDKNIKSYEGKNVAVGVFDHSIFKKHLGFNGSIKEFKGINVDFPSRNHGSFMAGIIGGKSIIKGIAPQVIIHELPIYNANGYYEVDWIKQILVHISGLSTPFILNISQSFYEKKLPNEIKNLFMKVFNNKNVIAVAAAGSNAELQKEEIQYPSSINSTIAVGSISRQYYLDNKIPKLNPLVNVVVPETAFQSFTNESKKSVGEDFGDSCATAVVSGVIALLLSSGKITVFDKKNILEAIYNQSNRYSEKKSFEKFNLINPSL